MQKSKMNLNLMLVASAITGAVFIYSCTKDDVSVNTAPPVYGQTNSAPYTPCTGVENPANPYDNVGAAHNAGLTYILDHKSQWAGATNEQWIQTNVDLTAQYLCANGYGSTSNCYDENVAMLNSIMSTYQASTVDDFVSAMGSPQAQDLTRHLFEEIETYADSNDIAPLIGSIKQLENEAMTSSMNPDDRRRFLEAASIARYSSCYWFQENKKSVTDWHAPDNPIPAGKFNWVRFGLTVFADVCGGIAGSWGGPVGTIGGAALVSGAFSAD